MTTNNGDTVPYGGERVVPTTARTAWAARLIVTQDGDVDLVHDRQGCAGIDRDAFLDLLQAEFPIAVMREKIGGLLRDRRMDTRTAEEFRIFQSADLDVRANTNGSAGYCYVAAWSRDDSKETS